MATCFLSNFVRQLKTTHNSCKQFHLFTFIFNLMKKRNMPVLPDSLHYFAGLFFTVRKIRPVCCQRHTSRSGTCRSLTSLPVVDTIMYVPLETSDSFLFSNISHLKVSRDQNIYFISDKSFFLFDGHTGKGKLKISRLGTGPDGYAPCSTLT